ncbi:MAG: L,D-transpeptidase [Proteobacteria bacterium]|nr:L,D-transpeptidase [Pseudomonadota bacterium]
MRTYWGPPMRICVMAALVGFICWHYSGPLLARTEDAAPLRDDTSANSPQTLELSSAYSPAQLDSTLFDLSAPLPNSLIVIRDHTIVRLAPRRKARRRGVVMKGTRLKPLGSSEGPGCKGLWYQVHTDGWICGDLTKPSELSHWGLKYPIVPEGELTPWQYGFVREPTIEYRVSRGELEEVREVLKGFGFGVEATIRLSDVGFFRTAEGTLIPRKAAGISGRISKFSGIEIKDDSMWPVGFVNARRTWAYSTPSRSKESRIGKVNRYTPFKILEESGKGRKRFYRFDNDAWLAAKDVRISTKAPLPKGIAPGEHWIDVDTKQQIMTAYEGEKPVYATLVSTGRIGGSRTVKGEFRIWAKVSAIPMDNTDEELEESEDGKTDAGLSEERKLYSLHDVPWAQFFFESYALHGVYWHDRFGNRRSHGCVNLPPTDARWFYNWTEPHLPDGWWAIHSSPNGKGTLVRVR